MTKVAVLDDWQGVARGSADWSALEKRASVTFFERAFDSEDHAASALADFDIVLSMRERTPFPATLLARLPKLRLLGTTSGRTATVDLPACTAHGIVASHTGSGPGTAATAEMALGLLIAAMRFIPAGDAAIRAGRFQDGVPEGRVLRGKTLGLLGLGRIGSMMAGYGRALGMAVLAWSQNLTPEKAEAEGTAYTAKDALLARSDAVSLHLVLSDRTRGLLGAAELARMKPGAVLINTSRGPLRAGLCARAFGGRGGAAGGAACRAHRRGAGRVRPRAAAGGSSAAHGAEHGADAASGLRRAGGVGAVLPGERRERAGVPGRETDPGYEPGGAGEDVSNASAMTGGRQFRRRSMICRLWSAPPKKMASILTAEDTSSISK
jgi:phosphoglycerate dehydrogenase-like enzyme